MSLSYKDLQSIRTIVEETVCPISSDIKVLSNDVKELYAMIDGLENKLIGGSPEELSIEKKLLQIHADLE